VPPLTLVGGGPIPLVLSPPLLLAPMAGLSSSPLRRLCVEQGAALATSELLVAACLARREPATLRLAAWPADEPRPRSAQIYGVRPADLEAAAALLVSGELDGGGGDDGADANAGGADAGAAAARSSASTDFPPPPPPPSPFGRLRHIDVNFGCPVRKITSRGGGAALPARPRLFASLVRAAVRGAAGCAAVTVKLRIGVASGTAAADTCLEAGAIAAAEGAAAVTLHCRRAEQGYAPPCDWGAAARLVERLSLGAGGGSGRDAVPVILNGDVCTGRQALRALRETGAGGVMVGRAALGRPWAFRGMARAMAGAAASGGGEEEEEEEEEEHEPTLGEALAVALRHAQLWAEHERWLDGRAGVMGFAALPGPGRRRQGSRGDGGGRPDDDAEARALLKMRRMWPLYTLGYDAGARDALLPALARCESVAAAHAVVGAAAAAAGARGLPAFGSRPAAWAATAGRLKTGPHGAVQRVALPDQWLAAEHIFEERAPDGCLDGAAEG